MNYEDKLEEWYVEYYNDLTEKDKIKCIKKSRYILEYIKKPTKEMKMLHNMLWNI